MDESRSLVLDVLHLSRNVPRFSVDRLFQLDRLDELRRRTCPRISWPILFCKAFARTAAEVPELRWCYVARPIPRVIEFPASVAVVSVNRIWRDRNRLFWVLLRDLETTSLGGLQRQLDHHRQAPLEDVFRRQLMFSRFPVWLRRPIWWLRLNANSRKRHRRVGTFALSVLAGQQAYNRNFPHFLTTGLTYGPLNPDGSMLVTLICDHRVVDGMTAATALAHLEQHLQGCVSEELERFASAAQAA
jgi:hypothetical protein